MSNFPISYITVHSAATKPSMDIGVDTIRRWHLDRGFNDVGYHYIIRRDGTVEKGRKESVIGAQVGGHNTGNIGVCMVGGVSQDDHTVPEDNYTHDQYTALTKLLNILKDKYPQAQMMGHNDFSNYRSRGCPCFNQHVYFDWFLHARKALHRPDDWFDNSKYDWHQHSADAWDIPSNFYQAVDFEMTPEQKDD